MREEFSRTELLLGREAMDRLASSRVAVFGIGGVGGYAAEALARSGVGALDLIDDDVVSVSNINRQIIALHSTVGMYKTEAAARRILDICPDISVISRNVRYSPETEDMFDLSSYDHIVDAVDTVSAKIALAVNASRCGTPVISSMGAGNKLDPCAFEVADIYDTSVCPLARVMRRELRKRGVTGLKVVYSKEPPLVPLPADPEDVGAHPKLQTPGSTAFVPAVAGLILAGEVIKSLAGIG